MTSGSPRQLWLLPVLLITVIATALGALVARDLYADPEPLPPAVVQPSPSSVPPSEQPGPAEVQATSDALGHPLYIPLKGLLQSYFDAINTKDYDRWVKTVTRQRQATQPKEVWDKDYRSTTDGSIVMYRIEASGDGTARVLLQFTSVQDVNDAPPELPERCIHWNVVWAFSSERDGWKLSAGATSSSPQHEACEKQ